MVWRWDLDMLTCSFNWCCISAPLLWGEATVTGFLGYINIWGNSYKLWFLDSKIGGQSSPPILKEKFVLPLIFIFFGYQVFSLWSSGTGRIPLFPWLLGEAWERKWILAVDVQSCKALIEKHRLRNTNEKQSVRREKSTGSALESRHRGPRLEGLKGEEIRSRECGQTLTYLSLTPVHLV